MRSAVTAILVGLLFVLTTGSEAQGIDQAKIPPELRAWRDWVLVGKETELCPRLAGVNEVHCVWPARLDLQAENSGATFTLSVDVQARSRITLPGDERHWPLDVRTQTGTSVVVLPDGTKPTVWLESGRYQLTGRLAWRSMPEVISIPSDVGVVALRINGRQVDGPSRDESGRLFLQRDTPATSTEGSFRVVTFRKVSDAIPIQITTHIDLTVSGSSREIALGPVLIPNSIPMSLSSPLPTRLEPDGRLRVQASAGSWVIELHARLTTQDGKLTRPKAEDPWPLQEVWAFEAQNNLRIADVEGVPSIDPNQTQMPAHWRALPAYVMEGATPFTIVERSRGAADLQDELTLDRTLWLDFDGRGYTLRDQLSGTLDSQWRVDARPPISLGRLAMDGVDQFLTQGDDGSAGVEVRTRSINAEADSRIAGATRVLPVGGWNLSFRSVATTLKLPPGWRLLHVMGADSAEPTWFSMWSLWNLFFVLVLGVALIRLRGWALGALLLVTLVLTYHEIDAPRWVWIPILLTDALVRVLPAGRIQASATWLHRASWLALILIAIPFCVTQIRFGLYPSLARGGADGGVDTGILSYEAQEVPASPNAPADATARDEMEDDKDNAQSSELRFRKSMPSRSKGDYGGYDQRRFSQYQFDPNLLVNTGAGIPSWSWASAHLSWQGPATPDQTVRLFFISPAMNLFLAVMRCGLLLILALAWVGVSFAPNVTMSRRTVASFIVLFLCVFAAPVRAANGMLPDEKLLQQLQERLLAPAPCQPNCAAISAMRVETAGNRLRLRLRAHGEVPTGLPLPVSAQWSPDMLMVDGKASLGGLRTQGGAVWILLPQGTSDVTLEGSLGSAAEVTLSLPMPPHRVESAVNDWAIDGIDATGRARSTIVLRRTRMTAAADPTRPQELPPFLEVRRIILFDQDWSIETTVSRLTPLGQAVVVRVPLIAGESVTTDGVRVENGAAVASLGAQAAATSWRSTLAKNPTVELRATHDAAWIEHWELHANPLWHVETSGIPTIHLPDSAERFRTWRPWPGETVTLTPTKPEGVPGSTLTVDRSSLLFSPGRRSTETALTLSLRSSRSDQFLVELPEGSDLLGVTVDDQTQSVRREEAKVWIPVRSGSQTAVVTWRQSQGIRLLTRTPKVTIGSESVNAQTIIDVPQDRWTILVKRTLQGPAVLFWSLLAVFVVGSWILAKLSFVPLSMFQWFLLSLGMTQVSVFVVFPVVAWFVLVGLRKRAGSDAGLKSPVLFNIGQLGLVGLTFVSLLCLLYAVQHGLLGLPEMQIEGPGSYASHLEWFADRSAATLPAAWFFSLPLGVYRWSMLAWALWLAWSVVNWSRWAWESFATGALWRTPAPRIDTKAKNS